MQNHLGILENRIVQGSTLHKMETNRMILKKMTYKYLMLKSLPKLLLKQTNFLQMNKGKKPNITNSPNIN